MKEYSDHHNDKLKAMVEELRKQLDFTSLIYQNPDDLVKAISLPKDQLCTHCWDGSSYFYTSTNQAVGAAKFLCIIFAPSKPLNFVDDAVL
jgi:glutamine phosphoribosylpyrophosphate amidotransferase